MNENEKIYFLGMALRDLDQVRLALDSGVPVDTPIFGHGATALIWAAGSNMEDYLIFLLKRGANVNTEDWEGVSPLRVAIQGRFTHIIKILLDHGADPLQLFPSRLTLLEEAELVGDDQIIDMIQQAITKNQAFKQN